MAYARYVSLEWYSLGLPDGSGVYLAGQIREDWIVVGFYVPLNGSLHLADLTFVPGRMPPEDSQSPFEPTRAGWLARRDYIDRQWTLDNIDKTGPPHAVYARLLRLVPLDEMQREADVAASKSAAFAKYLREHGAPEYLTRSLESLGFAKDQLSKAERRYLEAAVLFTKASGDSSRPVLDLAPEMGITTQQLSDRLSAARKLGYMTSPGKGRKGGQLTELGRTLAARHLKPSSE